MIRHVLAATAAAFVVSHGAAFAQRPPAGPGGPKPLLVTQPTPSMRGHVSIMISAGTDLDVLGHILTLSDSVYKDREIFVNPQEYPDIYFNMPFRGRIAVGIGFSRVNEVFGRYSASKYAAQQTEVGGVGNSKLYATLTPYHDTTIELGLRHYFGRGTVARYMSLAYGVKKIDAIQAAFSIPADSEAFTARLYDAGSRRTYALEFGMLFQMKHIGAFVEGGAQITSKLLRNDTDLTLYGLTDANNSGARFYMPAHVGVLFRF